MKRVRKNNFIIVTIMCFLFSIVSCTNKSDGYTEYQTFDHYSLKGVNKNNDTTVPYIKIKRTNDSILIVVLGDKWSKDLVIRKIGKFWYEDLVTVQEGKNHLHYQTHYYVHLERFYLKDTILTHIYTLNDSNSMCGERILLETRSIRIECYFNTESSEHLRKNNINERFIHLKSIIRKMLLINSEVINGGYCKIYKKRLDDDILYYYKKNEQGKYIFSKALRLSKLGEFFLPLAKTYTPSVIPPVPK